MGVGVGEGEGVVCRRWFVEVSMQGLISYNKVFLQDFCHHRFTMLQKSND